MTNYSSWIQHDGRDVQLETVMLYDTRTKRNTQRTYNVYLEGVQIGSVVRWRSAAPGRPDFPAAVWRAHARDHDGWVGGSKDMATEWPKRGDAIEELISLYDNRGRT